MTEGCLIQGRALPPSLLAPQCLELRLGEPGHGAWHSGPYTCPCFFQARASMSQVPHLPFSFLLCFSPYLHKISQFPTQPHSTSLLPSGICPHDSTAAVPLSPVPRNMCKRTFWPCLKPDSIAANDSCFLLFETLTLLHLLSSLSFKN